MLKKEKYGEEQMLQESFSMNNTNILLTEEANFIKLQLLSKSNCEIITHEVKNKEMVK